MLTVFDILWYTVCGTLPDPTAVYVAKSHTKTLGKCFTFVRTVWSQPSTTSSEWPDIWPTYVLFMIGLNPQQQFLNDPIYDQLMYCSWLTEYFGPWPWPCHDILCIFYAMCWMLLSPHSVFHMTVHSNNEEQYWQNWWLLYEYASIVHLQSSGQVSLYGQPFPRYRLIFKIAIYGH